MSRQRMDKRLVLQMGLLLIAGALAGPVNEPATAQSNQFYQYQYNVSEPSLGDIKSHSEIRQGSTISGIYRLLQPDGCVRVVRYTADVTGFHPVITYEGKCRSQTSGKVVWEEQSSVDFAVEPRSLPTGSKLALVEENQWNSLADSTSSTEPNDEADANPVSTQESEPKLQIGAPEAITPPILPDEVTDSSTDVPIAADAESTVNVEEPTVPAPRWPATKHRTTKPAKIRPANAHARVSGRTASQLRSSSSEPAESSVVWDPAPYGARAVRQQSRSNSMAAANATLAHLTRRTPSSVAGLYGARIPGKNPRILRPLVPEYVPLRSSAMADGDVVNSSDAATKWSPYYRT